MNFIIFYFNFFFHFAFECCKFFSKSTVGSGKNLNSEKPCIFSAVDFPRMATVNFSSGISACIMNGTYNMDHYPYEYLKVSLLLAYEGIYQPILVHHDE